MSAGPTKEEVRRYMNKATKLANAFTIKTGIIATPRLQRASNGEACIVYDMIGHDHKINTVLSLPKT